MRAYKELYSVRHKFKIVVAEMDETGFEKMLFDACEKFIEDIEKFELIYESDFRYAIYAEAV